MNMATLEQDRIGVQIARCREWIEAALEYSVARTIMSTLRMVYSKHHATLAC